MNLPQKDLDIVTHILKTHLDSKLFKVFVFGSRVDGSVQHSSDLDLLIQGSGPANLLILSALREDFEGSNLPYCVDIVDYHRIDTDFFERIKPGLKQIFF